MFSEKIKRVTVKKTKSNKYFVSFTLEAKDEANEKRIIRERETNNTRTRYNRVRYVGKQVLGKRYCENGEPALLSFRREKNQETTQGTFVKEERF